MVNAEHVFRRKDLSDGQLGPDLVHFYLAQARDAAMQGQGRRLQELGARLDGTAEYGTKEAALACGGAIS